MKQLLRNLLLLPTLLTSIFCGYEKTMLAVLSFLSFLTSLNSNCLANEELLGKLEIVNYVNNRDFIKIPHNTLHYNGCTEGYDEGWDFRYYPKYNLETVIISHIPGYEYKFDTESRPIDSFTPVNLELSLVSNSGADITLNATIDLWCSLPFAETPPYFADFGNKPITFWEKSIIDPNKDADDPNNYTLSFIGDIKEAIDKSDFYTSSGKTAKIPRPDLDGTYRSGVPYMYAQTRFDVFPGDFSLDGIVDMKDLAILGKDWGKQGEPKEFVGDITGPQGLPDGKVDYQDLELLTRYWLKDIRDIMP